MAFYKDTKPWTLDGVVVPVVDSNEHLGLVVSGMDEEQQNVDKNIKKCRSSLFALLGPAFAYKCLMSPIVQLHLWRSCCLPKLLSGLPSLPIRPANCTSLVLFQNKIMRGFLPALYFLAGELPVEGVLHIHTLNLFYNLWTNPSSTVYSMVKYILKMCNLSSSTTWSNHVQILFLKYDLPPPLSLIQRSSPVSEDVWKETVKVKITAWYENELRRKAEKNSKMNYLNVSLSGLSGRPHPVLHNILTTQDAKKLRVHLKFLCGDYMTNERLSADQPGIIHPACQLCSAPIDSIDHDMATCMATAEVRRRLFPDLLNQVTKVQPMCAILRHFPPPPTILTQFLLDCTSFNLPEDFRIPVHNPGITNVYAISRDWA